ncbi:MAG: TonB-dependent receptor, partial [Woeseiaceae bacterium]|nr:TonB-dependent receptor [Woeseiaceae bacterium]
MSSDNTTLRHAVRAALLTGTAVATVGYAPVAAAQADEALEEITVTGSRIVRQDYAAASPIATVDRELFTETGAPTIETVLNTLPQFVPAITSTSNNPSNGGQANVALRGLSTTRTLVLLDGRRITPSNATGVVDLNLIPASIIENIEIITGCATAVYASDAIDGVVNIKTREFEGLEVTGSWGRTSEDDGIESTWGVTGGLELADGRGYAFGTLSFSDRGGVLQGDRPFSDTALGWDGSAFQPLGSATIRQGRWDQLTSNLPTQQAVDDYFSALVAGYVPGSATNGSAFGFNPDGSLFDVEPVINFTGDLNEPQQPVNPASYTYNYSPPNFLQLPLERVSFFGRAGFDINDNAEGYGQFMWATYDVDQALAPTPATSLYVNIDNPQIAGNAALQQLLASRPDPTQPIRIRKRMLESGPRVSAFNYDVIQALVGAKGDLNNDWRWDAYASWGNVDSTEQQLGNVSRSAFEALSLAADHGAAACGGITPFGIGSISPECAAQFTRSATNFQQIRQIIGEANFTGPVFEMPAGDVQVAVGALYKYDDFSSLPDASLTQTRTDPVTGSTQVDIVGFNADDVQRGKTQSREVYIEANFPLVADAPAAQLWDVTLGYRLADHSTVGNISSYKAETIWNISDAWGFRGGYQRAVRAPNIDELFAPATINFPSVTLGDPCSNDFNDPDGEVLGAVDDPRAAALCTAQGIPAAVLPSYNFANSQVQGLQGGNPLLDEEIADTVTFGVVFQSPFQGPLAGLQASIDYYQIEIEDAISQIAADTFIQRCFNPAFNPNFENSNFFC